MGFSLQISTNSEAVLEAAAKLWARFPPLSNQPGVRLNIAVNSGATDLRQTPTLRAQEHLLSIIMDAGNFATADLTAGFGFAHFTDDLAADSAYLRYHFMEPLGYVLIAARHLTLMHASCVALNGSALLLCGDSGAGKTCLAFQCAREGWKFLSGDAIGIVRGRTDHHVIGRPFEIRFRHTARHLFPELEKYPRAIRPNGKTDIELDPQDLNLPWAVEGAVAHLVFLERSGDLTSASLEPFAREEAERRLEQTILYGDERIRNEQRGALSRFLSLPTFRLRYSDLFSAERALRSLVSGRG